MEIKKLFDTKDGILRCGTELEEIERQRTRQTIDRLRLKRVDKVLTALSRDWRQPLDQILKQRGVARMSLLQPDSCDLNSISKLAVESGKILLWPEEFISYEDPRNGLDVDMESVKKNLIRPIHEAMSHPCPDCTVPAYVVCNVHDAQGAHGTHSATANWVDPTPFQHAQILLLCPACVSISHYHASFKICQRCLI